MTENLPQQVIDAFGGLTKMSEAMNGVAITTIDGWRRSGRIPGWRREAIIAAAQRVNADLPAWFLAESDSSNPVGPKPAVCGTGE